MSRKKDTLDARWHELYDVEVDAHYARFTFKSGAIKQTLHISNERFAEMVESFIRNTDWKRRAAEKALAAVREAAK